MKTVMSFSTTSVGTTTIPASWWFSQVLLLGGHQMSSETDSTPPTIHLQSFTADHLQHIIRTGVYHWQSTIHHPPSTIQRLPSTVYHPPSTIYSLSFTVYHSTSTIHHLLSTVYKPLSTIHRIPSFAHLPSIAYNTSQPSTFSIFCYPPSAVFCLPSTKNNVKLIISICKPWLSSFHKNLCIVYGNRRRRQYDSFSKS